MDSHVKAQTPLSESASMIVPRADNVELLILGAGWTSKFLIPQLEKKKISFAATTTTGRDDTIPFKYDPESDDKAPFQQLPGAQTVLITFPLKGNGPSKHLTDLYNTTHPGLKSSLGTKFIQLGATFLWNDPTWSDENTAIKESDERGIAEAELMEVADGCILDLAGLYGGSRDPSTWVNRVVKSKEDLKNKGAIHLIHGNDVARAIIAVHHNFTPSKRWLLTDLRVYDWWDLIQDWSTRALGAAEDGSSTLSEDARKTHKDLAQWVNELMVENDVRALPRETSSLGRRLDARGFWNQMGIYPVEGRVR